MLAIFLLPLLAGVLGQDETPADDSSAPVVRTVYPQFWFYDSIDCSGEAHSKDFRFSEEDRDKCGDEVNRQSFKVQADPDPAERSEGGTYDHGIDPGAGCLFLFNKVGCVDADDEGDKVEMIDIKYAIKPTCIQYSNATTTYMSYKAYNRPCSTWKEENPEKKDFIQTEAIKSFSLDNELESMPAAPSSTEVPAAEQGEPNGALQTVPIMSSLAPSAPTTAEATSSGVKPPPEPSDTPSAEPPSLQVERNRFPQYRFYSNADCTEGEHKKQKFSDNNNNKCRKPKGKMAIGMYADEQPEDGVTPSGGCLFLYDKNKKCGDIDDGKKAVEMVDLPFNKGATCFQFADDAEKYQSYKVANKPCAAWNANLEGDDRYTHIDVKSTTGFRDKKEREDDAKKEEAMTDEGGLHVEVAGAILP